MKNLNITTETATEIAMQLVIMDAMEKGHTDKDGLIEYMKSETFANAVQGYLSLMA